MPRFNIVPLDKPIRRKLGQLVRAVKPSAHPFDPLLPKSRTQLFKKLLARVEQETSDDKRAD